MKINNNLKRYLICRCSGWNLAGPPPPSTHPNSKQFQLFRTRGILFFVFVKFSEGLEGEDLALQHYLNTFARLARHRAKWLVTKPPSQLARLRDDKFSKRLGDMPKSAEKWHFLANWGLLGGNIWRENCAGGAILDGFKKFFLENVRKTEICRMAIAEFGLGERWARYRLLKIPYFTCNRVIQSC